MFTIDDIVLSGITNATIHQARTEKLKSENFIIPKDIFKFAGTNSAVFYLDDNINSIHEVMTEYDYSDIRPSDIILDIGANIGGFSLEVHGKVQHVYAVEPLFIDSLRRNIELNNAKNVDIIPCALGHGEFDIFYNGRKRRVMGLSLEKIIKLCGGHVDFLKCDCEGGEWCMTLSEIFNIRRIEAEIHNFDGTHNFKEFENLLISSGFDYKKRLDIRGTMLISATNRYII